MRLLVLFDLPVTTKEDRKAAALFRKFLLKDGYYMLQFSCYCRICPSYEASEKHERRLTAYLPTRGSVRTLVLTENQYARMKFLVGEKLPMDKKTRSDQLFLF